MTTPEMFRDDAERYRRLLALVVDDTAAAAALPDLIAKCEADAAALEAPAAAGGSLPDRGD